MNISINELNEFDIIRSTFTVIFIIITLIVGIKILLNYFEHKKKVFLTVGLSLILLSGGYWSNAFSFLSILLFQYAFDPPLYLLLLDILLPIGLICWIYSIDELIIHEKKYKKYVYLIYLVYLAYIIFIIIALNIDYRLLGERVPGTIFDYSRTLPVFILTMSAGGIVLITGVLFARQSLHSEDPIILWKGRFFVLSLILIMTGLFLDAIFVGAYLLLKVSIRIILTVSSILFYLGFFLPDWLADKLIKS